jgi:cell wall-associated NlpC family hydrolase
MLKVGAGAAAGVLVGLVLLMVVLAGAGAQTGTSAAATTVGLENMASRMCVGLLPGPMSLGGAGPLPVTWVITPGLMSPPRGVAAGPPPSPAVTASLSQVQAQNAAAVIAVATAAGTGTQGSVMAVMTALTESGLRTGAGNGDHIGLFQQAPSWGTTAERLNPTDSAALFIRSLQAVPGWQQMVPWVAAQTVQRSQFDGVPSASNGGSALVGGNYEQYYGEAVAIVTGVAGQATVSGCGQQPGAVPATPANKGGLPSGYQLPPTADPVETRAITFALSKVGGPYVWGGNGPTGYDCSGLVSAGWAYAGLTIPRTSEAELGAGTPVTSYAAISPGDLVLVPGADGTLASPGHVAIYIGDGLVVAAADVQVGIIVQTYSSLISGGLSGIRHIG